MSDLIFTSSLYGTVGAIPYAPRNGATESLEFFSDVLQSYTNEAEERAQLRALPRNYFEYQHDASFQYQQEIYNAVRANIRGTWLIPLWFEYQTTTAALAQTVFAVDTLLHDLRADSHALLFKSICEWQVVTIAAITDTTIETVEECTLQGRVYVIPFRVGKLSGNAGGSINGYGSTFKLQYYVQDVLRGLTEAPTQYNGHDFYSIPYLIENSASVNILQAENQVEYSVGDIASDTSWARSMYGREQKYDGQGMAEFRAFKNYFYRRAGRFRDFYSPTFESNLLNKSTGTVASTFKFKDEGYVDRLFAHMKRIGFRLADGTWQVRNATAAANIGGGEGQMTLDSPLNVPAKDIELVSFVTLNRLDTDRVDITLGQNQYFSSSAAVVEIPE